MRKSPATFFSGLFETHLHVLDLERTMRFYGDVLGLELGRSEPERRAAFYWVGENRSTMLGLWEEPPWIIDTTRNVVRTQHIAFGVSLEDMNGAIQQLKKNGIELRDFFDQITDEPSVFGWMPAASIYFHDVDGHLLEFIARIEGAPLPDIGIVSLSEWNKLTVNSRYPVAVTIRPAVLEDADGIARTYIESAEYHASLDPERYSVPAFEAILARYREGRQDPRDASGEGITLVAECSGEIVGFIDAGLETSPDVMHREMFYCNVAEIAVRRQYQNQGIGERLLRAAEEWGRRQGAQLASLEYHAANTRAGLFYQRMGYFVASTTAIKRL
jgi:lactoylglutathione lyase